MVRHLILLGLCFAALLLPCGQAMADTVLCTPIESVPATISTPGAYCLQKNLTMRGAAVAAITIDASQVTLDCNDHTITKYSSSSAQYGVLGSSRAHLRVRNCGLHLFGTGIALVRSRVMEVRSNTISGSGMGMLLTGHSMDVFDNVVTAMYGSTNAVPMIGLTIETAYSGQMVSIARVVGNRIAGVRAYGIGINGSSGVLLEGNHVHLLANTDPGIAIWINDYHDLPDIPLFSNALLRGNYVFGHGSSGIFVASGSTAMCSENYIRGPFTNAIVNCLTDTRANTVW